MDLRYLFLLGVVTVATAQTAQTPAPPASAASQVPIKFEDATGKSGGVNLVQGQLKAVSHPILVYGKGPANPH